MNSPAQFISVDLFSAAQSVMWSCCLWYSLDTQRNGVVAKISSLTALCVFFVVYGTHWGNHGKNKQFTVINTIKCADESLRALAPMLPFLQVNSFFFYKSSFFLPWISLHLYNRLLHLVLIEMLCGHVTPVTNEEEFITTIQQVKRKEERKSSIVFAL